MPEYEFCGWCQVFPNDQVDLISDAKLHTKHKIAPPSFIFVLRQYLLKIFLHLGNKNPFSNS